MKKLFYKTLGIVAKIGFMYALMLVNVISANHMYEMKEPIELLKYKNEED